MIANLREPDPQAAGVSWPIQGAILSAILALNFFLRCYLDQAGKHLTSFLTAFYPEQLPEIYALPWWRYFLPIECLTGSWCTTGLLLVHALEQILGGPAPVYYAVNGVMIVTAYCLSWHVFRSLVFSITLSLCFALSTFNHHVYLVSGAVALPLNVTYLLCFLFCQYKLMAPDCRYALWAPLGLLSMVIYALGYECWLDCVACMGIAYPFLIAAAVRAGDARRAWAASAILLVTVLGSAAYVLAKTKLGHGQTAGSESDLVLNYGMSRILVGVDDVIVHFFTLFFITISTYLPPFLCNYSLSCLRYGTEQLIELQNGYHAQQAHLVGYNHLFLWRFYAGFAAAVFLCWLWKSGRAVWQTPSRTSVCFFVFLLMTLMSGTMHMLVKYRPMHSAPFLGYHSYFGIVGYSLLLSHAAWWMHANFPRRWLAWSLIAVLWVNLGYCALARPALLSHMAVQCGFSPYPDAWQNLKTLLRG